MNIEKDNTNVNLVNELADAYKNRLLQNKIDDGPDTVMHP